MKSARTITLALLVAFVFATGCDRCRKSDDSMDRAADARVTALSEALPADSEAAVLIPNLDQMRETVDIALTRISHYQPEIRMMEQQLSRELGLRITDAQSWEDAGINPDGSLMVAIVGSRPVVATYVDDRQAFESRLIERLRRTTNTESPIRNESIGDHRFKVSGDTPHDDMAWFYKDSMVFLVLPSFDPQGVYDQGSAVTVASRVATVEAGESLATSPTFGSFRQGLGDRYPISFYVDAESYFQDDLVFNFDYGINTLLQGVAANADVAGLGLRADERRLEVRAFAGGDDEFIEEARQAYTSDYDIDWEGMLRENTVLAIRSGFDLPMAFQTFLDSLPDDDRRRMQRDMANLSRNWQLDVQEDIIGAFSGNALLAFYGIGGDLQRLIPALMSGSIGDRIRTVLGNTGLFINFHFTDEDKLNAILAMLEEYGDGIIDRRNLIHDGEEVEDIGVFEPRELGTFPARLFHRENVVTVTAAGIGENAAYQYLTNTRSNASLAEAEDFPLGNRFASSDQMNGFYVNFHNLRRNIRNIPIVSGYAALLQPMHELLITSGVDDHGFFVDLILDFTEPLTVDEDQ